MLLNLYYCVLGDTTCQMRVLPNEMVRTARRMDYKRNSLPHAYGYRLSHIAEEDDQLPNNTLMAYGEDFRPYCSIQAASLSIPFSTER